MPPVPPVRPSTPPPVPPGLAPVGPSGRPSRWTVGRVLSAVLGALLGAGSLGLLAAGGGVLLADELLREDGYLMSADVRVDSPGHAVVSESIRLRGAGAQIPQRWLGDTTVEATGRAGDEVFVGIARTSDVDAYLDGVAYSVVVDPGDDSADRAETDDVIGGEPASAPTEQPFWVASASGDGTQRVAWEVESGDWTIVVMEPSGAAPVSADVAVGATVPVLDDVGVALLGGGGVLGIAATVLLVWALAPRRT